MGKLIEHLLRMFAVLALAFGASAMARAEVPIRTCIFPLNPGQNSAQSVLVQATPVACASNSTALGSGNFGARLSFPPQVVDPGDPLVLRHTSIWQQAERVVFRYGDGSTAQLQFDSGSVAQYMTVGALYNLPVPVRAAPLTGAYIEIDGSGNMRGVLVGASLVKRSIAARDQAKLIALYAAFVGLAIALIVYNLALWMALRQRFQLYYSAMVAGLVAVAFTSSGTALLALPVLDNNDRLRLNYVLMALVGIAAFRFIVDFFGDETLSRRLRQAVSVLGYSTLAVAVTFAALAPWQVRLLDWLYFTFSAIWLLMLVPIMVEAWRAKARHFWLFGLCWSAPIAAALIRAAYGLGLLSYNFWIDNGNIVALSIESLLSALLIVARLRDVGAERDQARAGERIAMRLANSDPLTGLLNRRAFLELAIGRDQPHRLLLIDIDHFKAINDRIGHQHGDAVLCEVAHALQRIRPPESLAVRLGGEEFALLVPCSHASEGRPDHILEQIRNHTMPMGIRVTVSLGYSEGSIATHDDWKRLYRLADTALYRAKADGRDRACRATDFTSVGAARFA